MKATGKSMRLAVVAPDAVHWHLKANCSATPKQVLGIYLGLSVASLGLASVFWHVGATLVLPFAVVEVVVLGMALLWYARHATDVERIVLAPHKLLIEQEVAGRCTAVEFVPGWVKVSADSDGSRLVVLSGQGRRVKVGGHLPQGLRSTLLSELQWALKRIEVR